MAKPADKIIDGLNEALAHAKRENADAPHYATIDQVSAGTILVADGGFTCIREGARLTVEANADGELFVPCSEGGHMLDGQLDDGDEYIGLTLATLTPDGGM